MTDTPPPPPQQPYRGSDVKEGVALPRGWLRVWSAACIVTALVLGLAVFLWLGRTFLFSASSGRLPSGAVVAFEGIAIACIALVAWAARRVATGRAQSPGLTVTIALAPALVAELFAESRLFDGRVYALAQQTSEVFAPAVLDPIAIARTALHATSAVGCAVTAVGCAGAVFSISRRDPSSSSSSSSSRKVGGGAIVLALSGIALAIAFALVRVHGTHRDGLGGFLPIVTIVIAVVIGPILSLHIRALASWHDREEARAMARAATCAILALALAGALIERAVFAHDEHLVLVHLSADTPFDVRLENAQAFSSAWDVHPIAMVIVFVVAISPAVTIVIATRELGLAFFVRSAWPRDRLFALGGILLTIAVALHFRVREYQMLSAAPVLGMSVELTDPIALPSAPGLVPNRIGGTSIGFGAALGPNQGELVPKGSLDGPWPFELMIDRKESATATLLAATELGVDKGRVGSIGVEGAPREIYDRLDSGGRALAGPSHSAIPLRFEPSPIPIHEAWWPKRPRDHVLLVLDDGDGIARFVLRTRVVGTNASERASDHGSIEWGKPRGMTLHRDLESRAKRTQLASDLCRLGCSDIILAPHPHNDLQALVDAMVAAIELAPHAVLWLSTDREHVESAITGSAGIVSP